MANRRRLMCLRSEIEISNNQVENAILQIVVGRKNWLFSDTSTGCRPARRSILSWKQRRPTARIQKNTSATCLPPCRSISPKIRKPIFLSFLWPCKKGAVTPRLSLNAVLSQPYPYSINLILKAYNTTIYLFEPNSRSLL